MAPPVFQQSYKEVSGNVAAPTFSRGVSVSDDDLLIIVGIARSSLVTGTPDASPSGFTLKYGGVNTTGSGIWHIWYKRVTNAASEDTSYAVDWATANTASGWFEVMRFTGARATGDPFDSSGVVAQTNSTVDNTVEIPAYSATDPEPLIVCMGGNTAVQTSYTLPGVAVDVIENSDWSTGPRGYGMYTVSGTSVSAQTMTFVTGTAANGALVFAINADAVPVPGPDADRIVVPRVSRMRV